MAAMSMRIMHLLQQGRGIGTAARMPRCPSSGSLPAIPPHLNIKFNIIYRAVHQQPEMTPISPEVLQKLTLWQRFQLAVHEGTPMFPVLRKRTTTAASSVILSLMVLGYLWQYFGDGKEEIPLKDMLKNVPRIKPIKTELENFDLEAVFASMDTNRLGDVVLPRHWLECISFLGIQLNSRAGLTSCFMHTDVLQLLLDAVLVSDCFILLGGLGAPTMPVYAFLFLLATMAVDSPKTFSLPFVSADDRLMDLQEKLAERADDNWYKLFADVNGMEYAVDDETGETGFLEGEDKLATWLDYIKTMTMSNATAILKDNAASQAFWVLTFLQQKWNADDVAALLQPRMGMAPVVSGAYMFAALEALFVARGPVLPYLGRTALIALGTLGAVMFPSMIPYMRRFSFDWPPATAVGSTHKPDQVHEIRLKMPHWEPEHVLSGAIMGGTFWILSMGPLRAAAFFLMRRFMKPPTLSQGM